MSHAPPASDIAYHPNHEHYHFAGFASDLLLEKTDGLELAMTKKGAETNFCVMDIVRMSGWYSAQYTACEMALEEMTVIWADTYGCSLSPERSVDRPEQQLAGRSYARGAGLRRSQIRVRRNLGRDDRLLAVHAMGIKYFPLQTIGQVIRHANVAAPVTVIPPLCLRQRPCMGTSTADNRWIPKLLSVHRKLSSVQIVKN
jgi:hypothetical protein